MKRFFISAAAILSAAVVLSSGFCSCEQKTAKEGYLWEISGNGLTEPSYLFGTFHGTFDIAYNYVDSIPGYHEAFDRAELVCGEIDPNSLSTGDTVIAQKMVEPLPSDSTYRELLSPADYNYLDSTLVAIVTELGGEATPREMMEMRPIQLYLMINTMSQIVDMYRNGMDIRELEKRRTMVMDSRIMEVAKEQSKATAGFETISEQLEMLFFPSGGSLLEDAKYLILGLKQAHVMNQLQGLTISAYRSGEFKEMERHFERCDSLMATIMSTDELEEYKSAMDKLLRVRNEAWMEKIPDMMAAQSTFIAVGAGHLQGEEGLIAMLREKGYTVTAVN